MRGNKQFIFAALFALLLMATTALAASIPAGTGFQITLTRYDPAPAAPGQYVTVWIKMTNNGQQDIPDLNFELTPDYPFSLDASETALKDIGRIELGEVANVNYKVRVDRNAIEGFTPLRFRYALFKGGPWQEAALNLKVQTLDAILSIESLQSSQEQIAPGQPTDVTISIKNNADSQIKQVNLNLVLVSQISSVTGTTITELPFTPIGKSNMQTIYNMGPGERRNVTFKLVADPDATSKPYKVPLYITYIDDLGKNYTRPFLIGLVVGSKPDLQVEVTDSSIFKTGTAGTVSLKIVNKGFTDAKFLDVILEDNGIYDIVSSPTFYVGSISSDDFETAVFTIIAKKAKKDKVVIPYILNYKDANYNSYQDIGNITLNLDHSKILYAKKGSSLGLIIFAVIVIGGGYWLYRRWEKKRKQKKA